MARLRPLDDAEAPAAPATPRLRPLDERELPGRGEEYGPPQPGVAEQYGPPAQMQQPPNVVADVAKGVGSGIERGVVGAPGMPTDMFRLAQLGWLTLQDKLYGEKGIIYQDPHHRARLEAQIQAQPSFLPGSHDIIEAAKPYVPGIGYEPQTKAGEAAQTFGEFIPGAVVPGQLAMRGASTAARVGRGVVDTIYQAAAPAAAAETADTYAKGTWAEPYAAPAAAVVTSLATGKLPLPNATTAAPGVSVGATSRVNRAIADEGGHAAAAAELQRLGPDGRLMDVGPNLTGQAEALVSMPGPAQSELLRVVRERNAAAGDRITAAVDRTLGNPADYERETQQLMDQRRLRAARFYGDAEGHTTPIDTTPVLQQIDRLLPPGTTANPTQIERALIDARGMLAGRSDMRSLHNVKEALDDQIAAAVRANEGGRARQLGQVRDQLVRQIDAGTTVMGPNNQPVSLYRQARQEYAGDSAILRAREEGLSVFNRDVDPRTLAREQVARSQSERDAFQEGARQAVELKMGNARNDALAVRNTFEVPYNRAKLIQVVGQPAAEDLLNVLGQETRIAGTNARLTTQSATAGRQAAQKEFPSALPESKAHWPSITELPTRALQGLYENTIGRAVNALNGESRGTINRDAGRILSMPGGAERDQMLEQLRRAYEGGDRRTPSFAAAPIAGWSAGLDEDRHPLEITVHPSRRR
jgi:hypothetical protein